MKDQTTPIVKKRSAQERGSSDHGWLQARFTFSFADYHDPDHMGFRSLRVMNNDTIQPGGGFPTHAHESMEIFTYLIEGQLEHRDSMGNGAVIEAGNLQYMSAGSGVQHSEFNPSKTEKTHLYQVWIEPKESGGEPRYAEMSLRDHNEPNSLTLLFSGDGRDGSTSIRQNAEISYGQIDAGKSLSVPTSDEMPHAWIQVISGSVSVFGETLTTGDGLSVENVITKFAIDADSESKLLLFRLN